MDMNNRLVFYQALQKDMLFEMVNIYHVCETWVSHGSVIQDSSLQGCYAVLNGK
jgi:hypothetical protein